MKNNITKINNNLFEKQCYVIQINTNNIFNKLNYLFL